MAPRDQLQILIFVEENFQRAGVEFQFDPAPLLRRNFALNPARGGLFERGFAFRAFSFCCPKKNSSATLVRESISQSDSTVWAPKPNGEYPPDTHAKRCVHHACNLAKFRSQPHGQKWSRNNQQKRNKRPLLESIHIEFPMGLCRQPEAFSTSGRGWCLSS